MTSSESDALRSVLVVVEAGADPPGEQTPLAAAGTPGLDSMARRGRAGEVDLAAATPWHGFLRLLGLGSHVSLGFASALGKGIEVPAGQLAYRADFATVDETRLLDPYAGDIDDPEAQSLLEDVARAVTDARFGRLVGPTNLALVPAPAESDTAGPLPEAWHTRPPWAAAGRRWRSELPAEGPLRALSEAAHGVLVEHDVNLVRLDLGENPANALWVHGGGPAVEPPEAGRWAGESVQLVGDGPALAGLGSLMGWPVTLVDRTDDEALAAAVLAALAEHRRVVVRSSSVLRAAVLGGADGKRDALAALDARLVSPVLSALEERGDFSLAVAADCVVDSSCHEVRLSGAPFVAYGSGIQGAGEVEPTFTEQVCAQSGLHLHDGRALGELLLG